jgi:pimeloyl-ACP methyl ester carboxylesterase
MRKLFLCLLGIVALSQVAVAQKSTTNSIPLGNNPSGKMYKIRGFNMYTETYGKGQPLLIIHGNGGSMKDFVNQVPFFMKNYQVIMADNRAQGRSTDQADSLSYEQMADDFAALLTAMHIDSAYVIGWSDGGINGLLLAIRHPEKVKKLAVTGANLWPDSTAVYEDVADLIMPSYNTIMAKANPDAGEKTTKKLLRLLVEQPHISTGQLQGIKCPTLVIAGDHDVIRTEHTMLIAQNIPQSYLWILPNSGHSTPIVYKNQFNATVADFFRNDYKVIDKEKRFN